MRRILCCIGLSLCMSMSVGCNEAGSPPASGSGGSGGSSATGCGKAGDEKACVCTEGRPGIQYCLDGVTLSVCACKPVDAGTTSTSDAPPVTEPARVCAKSSCGFPLGECGKNQGTFEVCSDGIRTECAGHRKPTDVAETCNGVDDDCNGIIDDGCECRSTTETKPCGTDKGRCELGHVSCIERNGKLVWSDICEKAVGPDKEVCDDVDNDCNGLIDEGWDKTIDVLNCGKCGKACTYASAGATCVAGACVMGGCLTNWYDLNGLTVDGCEYACVKTNKGVEQCDGIDNDCNGKIDDGTTTCECSDIGSTRECGPSTEGACRPGKQKCVAPGSWSTCDLAAPAVGPSKETCNGIDDDCDGVKDNGFDKNTDVLNCGFCGLVCAFDNATPKCAAGKCAIAACEPGYYDLDGNLANGCEYGQCVKAGAETCNGRDDDCNGKIDEGTVCVCDVGSTQVCNDLPGECRPGMQACAAPGSIWSVCGGPTYTGPVTEVCNGKDDDCDGVTDNGFNKNTDVKNCGSCGNVCTYANAVAGCAGGTCALGACQANWFNANNIAADGCEYACVVTNNGIEKCDGIDNNCNGTVDEGFNTASDALNCGSCGNVCNLFKATPSCGVGACKIASCLAGYVDLDSSPANGCEYACTPNGVDGPSSNCDGIDNDCDGSVDEGCGCTNGTVRNCGTDKGMCEFGTQTCVSGAWGLCSGGRGPGPEVCDAADWDCDGQANNGFDMTSDKLNCGGCGIVCNFAHAGASCVASACVMLACDPFYKNLNGTQADGCEFGACIPTLSGVEACDNIDNDCNGIVDDGFNKATDPMNCGACGTVCNLAHAVEACTVGACAISACDAGYVNLNGNPADGCEYFCTVTNGGVEACDGADNDCDGQYDENGIGGNVCTSPAPPAPPVGAPSASVGTIDCVAGGTTNTVTITGMVTAGLVSTPVGTITSLALGIDVSTCWSPSVDCFTQPVNPPAVDGTAHAMVSVQQGKNFLPRVRSTGTAVVYFDPYAWTVTGVCKRVGCTICRPGETCLPPPAGFTAASFCGMTTGQ